MQNYLDFEKPILDLEDKLNQLIDANPVQSPAVKKEIQKLRKKIETLTYKILSHLTPWEQVQLARHPLRPYSIDYINQLFPDFKELHGDRRFGDDPAVVAGMATWNDAFPLLIIGHQKGRTTKEKISKNFGMAKPEGYRKAIRLMQIASRFKIPILTFIDTPGAYPGVEAEERGQAQAIAECIEVSFQLHVPMIAIVIGEGGSGGAIAFGVSNRVLMLEFSMYSVISPESCASILWSDTQKAPQAAEKLKMDAKNLLKLGMIDGIIPEPAGGAHKNPHQTIQNVKVVLLDTLDTLMQQWNKDPSSIVRQRIQKFHQLGNQHMQSIL
jgi:acetyl-CoA carboxylase carboxyl transferase subunit alpha